MSDRLDEIRKAAMELAAEERERLALELLESVEEDDLHIDPEELAEIEGEADDILAGRVKTEPWDAVRERLDAKYRK